MVRRLKVGQGVSLGDCGIVRVVKISAKHVTLAFQSDSIQFKHLPWEEISPAPKK